MKRKIEVEISSDAFCALAALAYFSGLHPEDIAVEIPLAQMPVPEHFRLGR